MGSKCCLRTLRSACMLQTTRQRGCWFSGRKDVYRYPAVCFFVNLFYSLNTSTSAAPLPFEWPTCCCTNFLFLFLRSSFLCTATKVARSYGFKRVVSARHLLAEDNRIYWKSTLWSPEATTEKLADHPPAPVEAIFVFHDPLDWALEMQVLMDLLAPPVGSRTSHTHIPLYSSNADLVYTNEHPRPRLTQVDSTMHICVCLYV